VHFARPSQLSLYQKAFTSHAPLLWFVHHLVRPSARSSVGHRVNNGRWTSWFRRGPLQECWVLAGNKTAAMRLRFSLMLKFFEREADFASNSQEFALVVARQVGVAAAELGGYGWDGRTSTDYRVEIRNSFGFRICTRTTNDQTWAWFANAAQIFSAQTNGPDHSGLRVVRH
jgi:Domain of unknown function (DUF4158)